MGKNNLLQAIKASGSGSGVDGISLVRTNPGLAAMMSKAVASAIPAKHTSAGTRQITMPDANRLNNVANETARSISEAQTVLSMLPETELAAQILISSILSPKDMMTQELSYLAPPGILPSAVAATVTAAIRDRFDTIYKIKQKLPRILREIIFLKGSYVAAVIAENAIDDLINRNSSISMESYKAALESEGLAAPHGILGNPDMAVDPSLKRRFTVADTVYSPSLESMTLNAYRPYKAALETSQVLAFKGANVVNEFVKITDNPTILKAPALEQKLRRDNMSKVLGINSLKAGIESFKTNAGHKLDDRTLSNLIYKGRKSSIKSMEVVKTQNQLNRISVGSPLILELPTESVIPVFTPGQEERHVGYFVMLDGTGNPVKLENFKDTYRDLGNRFNFGNSQSSNIVNRLKELTEGFDCNNQMHLQNTVQTYGDMVEQDFLARLRNGMYQNGVSIARNEDFYRVMLARTMAQQRTNILFMPVETVTYFALKYNQNGIGVSYMEEMKILNNLRAITMFTNTMAAIKNSISRVGVNITLDPDDPDPSSTKEIIMSEIVRVNQNSSPLGLNSPADIVHFLQRGQFQFRVTGHEGMPGVEIGFEESSTNYVKPDTDLEESLLKRSLMTLGLNSEIVNNGFNQETATSVVANNLMLSRRVMTIQDQLNPHLTDHHKKIMRVDEPLLDELRAILLRHYDDLQIDENEIKERLGDNANVKTYVINVLLSDFIEGLEIMLPRPNTATQENQKSALQSFQELLEIALDAYINSDFFTDELAGKVAGSVDQIKAMYKAHFTREFMAEHGIMPELSSIVTIGDDGSPELDLWDSQRIHMEKLTKSISKYISSISDSKKAADKVMDDLENTMPEGSSGFEGDSDTSGGDALDGGADGGLDGLGGDADGMGGGDAGGDDPFAGVDEPAPEEKASPDAEDKPVE